MSRPYHIVRKITSTVTVTLLMFAYLNPGMKVLCSVEDGKSMPCCTSESLSGGSCSSQNSDIVSIKSAHQCPCPTMQSGPDKSFDEILPNAGKTESKAQSSEFISAPSKTYISSISGLVLTGYVHSYLSPIEHLSLLQTFLI